MTSTAHASDTTTANTTLAEYQRANAPLSSLIAAVPTAGWTSPSPCDGWTAADVVRHMIDTQRDFLSQHGLPLGAAPEVDADPGAAWSRHTDDVLEAIADDTAVNAEFDGFFGRARVGEAFVQFYVWDMIVHRWDIARAAALDAGLTDHELDRVERGIAGFGDALYMDGICRPGASVPDDADRTTRVLATLGRQA